eukprot:TRINITY_DN6515_c0_g2_i1.p1 TRINITY_DN6515_c0_g2~~TRINITY_DN6515_c0_g2_i1.p1  ORF type:complete len:182 (-),score=16.59 TRINITY_DN6515_c0_g2_i1:76-621(-)
MCEKMPMPQVSYLLENRCISREEKRILRLEAKQRRGTKFKRKIEKLREIKDRLISYGNRQSTEFISRPSVPNTSSKNCGMDFKKHGEVESAQPNFFVNLLALPANNQFKPFPYFNGEVRHRDEIREMTHLNNVPINSYLPLAIPIILPLAKTSYNASSFPVPLCDLHSFYYSNPIAVQPFT